MADEVFGIKAFQQKHKLDDDGIVGKNTARKIAEVFNLKHPALFLGQLSHESSNFTKVREEGHRYTAKRLQEVFSYYRNRPVEAQQDAFNEKAIFNKVYADKNRKKGYELGNVHPNDGWYFRGNGPLMLTGRRNHKAFENWLVSKGLLKSGALMNNPDIVWKQFYLESAIWFFEVNNLFNITDVKKLTLRVNGGTNGLADRIEQTNKFNKYF